MPLDNWDLLKIAVEMLGPMVVLIGLIVRLHMKNVDRLNDLHMRSTGNGEQLQTIRMQLDHQDKCIDEMKRDALTVARENKMVHRADLEEELSRMRTAISAEMARNMAGVSGILDDIRERLRSLETRSRIV